MYQGFFFFLNQKCIKFLESLLFRVVISWKTKINYMLCPLLQFSIKINFFPFPLSSNFWQLHCHKFFFFLFSNFGNLTATVPIKFSLSSPLQFNQLGCHNSLFPLGHSSKLCSLHFGQEFQ